MPNAVPSIPADGNLSVIILTAMAGDAPTVSEIEASTSADVSCYLTPDGFALTIDQATITDDRLCSTETFNKPGRKSYTLQLTGIDNSNSEFEDEYNELVDILPEGAQRYAVYRRGVAYDSPYEVGQEVRVVPFQVGVRSEVPAEANSVIRSMWNCFVTGPSKFVDVVAGGGA